MNAEEHTSLRPEFEPYDELTAAADDSTVQILEQRRRARSKKGRGWLVRRMLLAADLLGLLAAMLLAEWVVNRHNNHGVLNAPTEMIVFIASLPCWVVIAKLYGLYDRDEERTDHSTADDFVGIFHMVTVCTWLLSVGSYLTGLVHPTIPKLAVFWISAVVLVTATRATARSLARRRPMYLQNAVMVGAGDVGQLIARKILQHREYGVNLVGFVDTHPKERRRDLEHLPLLGETDALNSIVRRFDIERVIIAFPNETHDATLAALRSLKDLDVRIDIVPRLFEMVGPSASIHPLEGLPLVGLPPLRLARSSLLLKRSLDIVLSAALLIVLIPALIVIAVLVKVDSEGPVLYLDERVGRNGGIFRALKFRTMHVGAEATLDKILEDVAARTEFDRTHKLSHDPRVTRVGRILRRTSLDELPQLVNVVRGEVSLVGPRPITRYEHERYCESSSDARQSGYWEFNLRPGLTGYWQINGRSSMDYEDRLRLDLTYVTGWSLALDLMILAKTARVLATRRGAV